MITFVYIIKLAARNLLRGGQRVFIAFLCIAFGVMTLVAMTSMAKSIETGIRMQNAQLVGGDLSMGRDVEVAVSPDHVKQLEALQKSGEITRFTLIAFNNSSIMFRGADSGEMNFIGTGMGIQPDVYPLAGSLTIGEPGSTGLPTLLQQPGDVIVTRDVAEEFDMEVGDRIVLSDLRYGTPINGVLRGVAYDTPNHQGEKIYYTIETAEKLSNAREGQPVVNTVIATSSNPEAAHEKLESTGWSVDWYTLAGDAQTSDTWMIGLRGAGLLGLLVGAIGIAHTMQILLRRRQNEIAVWKTLGYHESHLHLLFSLEAGLLGLAGSLAGAGLGVLISDQTLKVFRGASSILYQLTFSPEPPLLGILTGTMTTIIFAFWSIVVSSQARPMGLLRNEPVDGRSLPWPVSAGLICLLGAPLFAVAWLVMGSAGEAILAILGLSLSLAVLGACFSGMLWLSTRYLPFKAAPLVRMAFKNLRRRGPALIFAMMALFIGVLAMSLGLIVVEQTEGRIAVESNALRGYNINILSSPEQESAVQAAIKDLKPDKFAAGYRAEPPSPAVIDGEPVPMMNATLVGRSDPSDYVVNGAKWGSRPDGVYVIDGANLPEGSRIDVTLRDGVHKTLTVAGTYQPDLERLNIYPPLGLLMPAEIFKQIVQPDAVVYFVQVAPGQVKAAASELAASLPQATVIDLAAFAARDMHSAQKLYFLPVILAGLAFLGGLLLIANSVSLALLDRRYEIGILKSVGYTRRQILLSFAVEYGIAGLLATAAGLLLVETMLALLAFVSHISPSLILLSVPSLLAVILCGVGLTGLTVVGVAWNPTRVSPLKVLNEQT